MSWKRSIFLLTTLLLVLSLILAGCAPAEEDGDVVEPGLGTEEVIEPEITEPVVEPEITEPVEPEMTETVAPEVTEPVETETAEPEVTEAVETEAVGTETAEPGEEGVVPGTGEELGGVVNVLGVWGGDELASFEAMIAPFEEMTGVDVMFEGTRDLNAVLTTRVQGGNPPDVAGLPGPGQLLEYARGGTLIPLDDVVDMDRLQEEYDAGFLELATVDDQLYGVFIKATVKSLIWYSPTVFEEQGFTVPTTWEEMNALEQQIIDAGGTPWCIGLESGAASGWPGTDWIEDIMLRTAGPETYDQWVQHEIPWTDEAVRNAWDTWGTIVNDPQMVYGGQPFILSTNFGESVFPLFQDPPQCYMHRQANFITANIEGQFPDLEAGQDYNFFTFPPIEEEHGNPLLIAGDLFGMFNDTPQARALIEYLTSAQAQQIWAERGGFLAPNRAVSPDVYPDEISQQIASQLVEATSVRFDASDMMPEAVNNAFWSGILDFVSDPANLDNVLQNIEQVAEDAYTAE